MNRKGESLVILSKIGVLYFSQHRDSRPAQNVDTIPCTTLARPARARGVTPEPRALAFTGEGTEFLLLTGNVLLSLAEID